MDVPLLHTLYELQVLPSSADSRSVFDRFNQTRTYGGREQLRSLFTQPSASPDAVRQRRALLLFITEHLDALTVDVKQAYVTAAEAYLLSNLAWVSAGSWAHQYRQGLWLSQVHTADFNQLQTGLAALQLVLRSLDKQSRWLRTAGPLPDELATCSHQLNQFFEQSAVQAALRESDGLVAILRADRLFRHEKIDAVRNVINWFYQLDAYCAIGRFSRQSGWVYPEFIPGDQAVFEVEGLGHPLLPDTVSVRNDFRAAPPNVLTVFTGGNMSGKTTFLKACGIAVYLAHLGLPIPAQRARLTFFDSLVTSIQLSDHLEAGHSHFYSELMRLKVATDALRRRKRVFLAADELFRGTNPQDALLCTHLVLDKLIQQRGSLFMVSSHLPGVGETYQDVPAVQLACFRTRVIAGRLVFTYLIEAGVTEERSGRLLLEQTGILDRL